MPVCSDQITTEVTMGNFSMSRTEPCRKNREPTPAFDEIVQHRRASMQRQLRRTGRFNRAASVPAAVGAHPGFRINLRYTIKVDAAGRGR